MTWRVRLQRYSRLSSIRHAPRLRLPARRGYAHALSSPPQAEYTFGYPWQIITPVLILGGGSLAMILWYFSSNEFLDAGFPPRAAESFRIASIAAEDWQLRRAIQYWRRGLEIAIEGGISPFDDRILDIKGRLMNTIKREGDIGAQREVLYEIREQCLQELRAGNVVDRGKLVLLAIKSSLSLGAVRFLGCFDGRLIRTKRMKLFCNEQTNSPGLYGYCTLKINVNGHYPTARQSIGVGSQIDTIE
jgi:hypothetical protein